MTCPTCKGSTKVRVIIGNITIIETCATCNGSGEVEQNEEQDDKNN